MSDRPISGEEFRNDVVHRHHQGQSERGIANQLGVSRWMVTKVLRQFYQSRGVQESSAESPQDANSSPVVPEIAIPGSLGKPKEKRNSKLDAFEPQILGLMDRYPRITVIRLQEELQHLGYTGGYSILAERVRQLRARPAKPKAKLKGPSITLKRIC